MSIQAYPHISDGEMKTIAISVKFEVASPLQLIVNKSNVIVMEPTRV